MNRYIIRIKHQYQEEIGELFVLQVQYNCWPPEYTNAYRTKGDAKDAAKALAKEYRAEGAEVVGWG